MKYRIIGRNMNHGFTEGEVVWPVPNKSPIRLMSNGRYQFWLHTEEDVTPIDELRFRVVGNTTGHGFEMGEEVYEYEGGSYLPHILMTNGTHQFWVHLERDVERIDEIKDEKN